MVQEEHKDRVLWLSDVTSFKDNGEIGQLLSGKLMEVRQVLMPGR